MTFVRVELDVAEDESPGLVGARDAIMFVKDFACCGLCVFATAETGVQGGSHPHDGLVFAGVCWVVAGAVLVEEVFPLCDLKGFAFFPSGVVR